MVFRWPQVHKQQIAQILADFASDDCLIEFLLLFLGAARNLPFSDPETGRTNVSYWEGLAALDTVVSTLKRKASVYEMYNSVGTHSDE
jgi:hypothetical protein